MLQIKNLYKVFNKDTANENVVFNNFNFKVDEGDFITIIGSNGAGKSTLLNLISGTIKPDEGVIQLKDKEISKMPEYECTKFIGRVFQDPSMGTAPSMTILENMSMAYNKGKRFGFSFAVDKNNIEYFRGLLSELELGLEDKLNTKVGLLSGGQRQALAIIMTVMGNPQILLLDEHTAALDPKTSEKIIDLTESIVREKKMTTLMVTHNLNHAINLGNRLIMLHHGEIILDIRGEEKRGLTIEKLLKYFENNFKEDDLLSDRALFS
ncbi:MULTISPECIES: ABC transporter ATP-binding protein [Clostridium]|uniref:Bicarbonate transport ATP-binding protein CmpD n=2 Tax=Clostridium TaxID=1485 RepID=A0A151AN16_9CLOT|nr:MULTISPECIES: ATP-binding cassette domain-containing protein [Clostridium]KYH29015.1 bicarbonate transport ATP-binding protein CmpD [Clostridium colicanis DSM 13634]MBE6043386.1 ATP-binding cassette domain-containing protein [Clostridium thermopalmarium]PRR73680.1 Bicarbonate transport ATP-binding protein CmpD [Clostridium thermopalmarium DSM 5974]PVZ21066.1 putative ABC transport system ATP-binding protein [Clostridium thermopalmarium DSM 5974]